jgi:dolichol-phosphate mannosyltransferase
MGARIQGRTVYLGLPAFNESAAIAPLFDRIRLATEDLKVRGLADDLVVIFYDDGSTDDTAAMVRNCHGGLRVFLLTPARNGGLGRGLQGIISYFLEVGNESDVLVIMDCDDTHDPGQIADLLTRIDVAGDDVVIASRYRAGAVIAGVPLSRQILSLGFAFLVKAVLPIKGVRDYSCGYRAYSYPTLKGASSESGFSLSESGFSAMPEILIRLRGRGWQFGEIPLHLAYDQRQTQSKMRAWQNSKRLLQCVAQWRFVAPGGKASRPLAPPALDGVTVQRFNQNKWRQ